jgi:SpoVK/Ycf46/Vps4 family AAA+-type ATPase
LDGAGTSAERLVLLIGATNRPQELDDAARRRFIKRLYIRLPNEDDRFTLLTVMLKKNHNTLTEAQVRHLAKETETFSGADLKSLCTDAAMNPIRELGTKALNIDPGDVPPISYRHFKKSLRGTRPSVAQSDLEPYEDFDRKYGSHPSNQNDDDDDDDDDDVAESERR